MHTGCDWRRSNMLAHSRDLSVAIAIAVVSIACGGVERVTSISEPDSSFERFDADVTCPTNLCEPIDASTYDCGRPLRPYGCYDLLTVPASCAFAYYSSPSEAYWCCPSVDAGTETIAAGPPSPTTLSAPTGCVTVRALDWVCRLQGLGTHGVHCEPAVSDAVLDAGFKPSLYGPTGCVGFIEVNYWCAP